MSYGPRSGRVEATAGNARRDLIALAIATGAIILFIGIAGALMPQVIDRWTGNGGTPTLLLTNALLLNVALVIFGWRRHKDLNREIAERRRAEETARRLAETDPLTNCLNRRSFTPAIGQLCEQAMERGREVAVLLIDLDDFKQINDLNGHTMGDAVLTTVAGRIRRLLPADGLLARIGGDEFVCATSFPPEDREKLGGFCQALIESVSEPVMLDGLRARVTVSVGIAATDASVLLEEGIGDRLVHWADIAMYQSKKSGRNRICWFEPAMEDELRFRNQLENAIRKAIPAGEFFPYYEQQIDLATGELLGFEMLARWQSPQYGLVNPEVFIPIAEELNLIGELSESLIRRALADAQEWDPSLTLSANVSPVQLRDPWFAQKILRILADCDFPPERFELEITEACLHANIGATRTAITALKSSGVRVSLDDFGTGYSSLTQLRSLPFDRLKIDRSFVQELSKGDDAFGLVEAIVRLGKGLSLPVTAEGVESGEVLDALKRIGNVKGQGHFYGKPEDGPATRKRLRMLGLLARSDTSRRNPKIAV